MFSMTSLYDVGCCEKASSCIIFARTISEWRRPCVVRFLSNEFEEVVVIDGSMRIEKFYEAHLHGGNNQSIGYSILAGANISVVQVLRVTAR